MNFDSYGARRGNHEVTLTRGTFANVRIKKNLIYQAAKGESRCISRMVSDEAFMMLP